jgi:hypothetical protein
MSNAHDNTRRADITLHTYGSSDPCGPVQVYTDGAGWVGGVYREEPGEPWQVCHTNADGSQPVRGTFDTARIAAVALVERREQEQRAAQKIS